MYQNIYTAPNDYLIHHGIKGQKWGIRRYQNPDGTLTPAGRERYYKDRVKQLKKEYYSKTSKDKRTERGLNKYISDNYGDDYKKDKKIAEERSQKRMAIGLTTAAVTVASVALVGSALYTIGNEDVEDRAFRNRRATEEDRINNILNDESGFDKINKDTEIKRLVFNAENNKDDKQLFNEALYVNDDKTDAERYKLLLANQKSLFGSDYGKQEVTYEAQNDIYIAKGKVALEYALEALGSDKSVDELSPDSPEILIAQRALRAVALKDENGKVSNAAAQLVRNKLIEEGIGGVKDYTDAGLFGNSPKVLFKADEDLEVKKIKKVSDMDKEIAKIKVGTGKILGK